MHRGFEEVGAAKGGNGYEGTRGSDKQTLNQGTPNMVHAAWLFSDIYGVYVVRWICPPVQDTSVGVLVWDRRGPLQANGEDYEVGANSMVHLIVLCLWE